MSQVSAFHSVNEPAKPASDRVYHDQSECPSGRDIPRHERKPGTGGYRHCMNCSAVA